MMIKRLFDEDAEDIGPSPLDMACRTDEDCWPMNSECVDDGNNEGTKRCQCASGYQQYSGEYDGDHADGNGHQPLCGMEAHRFYFQGGLELFGVSAPSVWNSLSFGCRSAQLAISFRLSMLTTELIDIAYSEH